MSMIHLRLSIYYAKEHAQVTMKKLGITYQYAVPQSMGDQWWFFNCKNIPENLPKEFSELKGDPFDFVGHGLSTEMAEKITAYKGSDNEQP